MLKFVDTDHFLEHMREVQEYAVSGWAGIAVDYEQLIGTPQTPNHRDFAADRFDMIQRHLWFTHTLKEAFREFHPDQVSIWWVLRALKVSRKKAKKHHPTTYSQKFINSLKMSRLLDELDQALLDILGKRKLLTYERFNPEGEEILPKPKPVNPEKKDD